MPDHVKSMVLLIMRHRIILSAELVISCIASEQVLTDILVKVPAPRQWSAKDLGLAKSCSHASY